MTRVKICGVTNAIDLRAVVETGADAVGLITDVSADTPREVDRSTAADLAARTPPFLTSVLVTMADTPEEAVDTVRSVAPDVVQLHAEFSAEQLGYVRAETETKVIPVVDADSPHRADDIDEAADAILVDSTTEDGAGGTGETHDWSATADLVRSLSSPVVLAGGLTPENVADAIRVAEPFAVDVASGVERSGGAKDHTAVARFVRNAGRALDEPAVSEGNLTRETDADTDGGVDE
ncbi:MAG: phosphoribosylanthranilate isomerase [Halobaculum sp.]|jgi:phosphoribosylanthranilate isomerase